MSEQTTGRTFAYCRVSTIEQPTENQRLAIEAAGYPVLPARVVTETISGSVPAMERPQFSNMVNNRLEAGDTLVVLKLDRLGRDNIDVQQTVTDLLNRGIRVICLDLPVKDLTDASAKLMLQLMATFAEFERNRIRERTVNGMERARSEGKQIGRPEALETTAAVQHCKTEGMKQTECAGALGLSLATVKRHWNKQ